MKFRDPSPPTIDILDRLMTNAGNLTLDQIFREREAAASEIRQLRQMLEEKRYPLPKETQAKTGTIQSSKASTTTRPILLRLIDVTNLIGMSRSMVYQQARSHRL